MIDKLININGYDIICSSGRFCTNAKIKIIGKITIGVFSGQKYIPGFCLTCNRKTNIYLDQNLFNIKDYRYIIKI